MAKWKELPPSPEAIVRAALERAADLSGFWMGIRPDGEPDGTYCAVPPSDDPNAEHYVRSRRILALASNPAEVAAIISAAAQLKKVGDGNKERSDEEDRG